MTVSERPAQDASPSEPLPLWAQASTLAPSDAAAPPPGTRWLASARRWLATDKVAAGPAVPRMAAGPSSPSTASGRAAAGRGAALPLERVRRCVAHALRHPGYGFALLRLVGATVAGDGRQALLSRLHWALRPGDALVADAHAAGLWMVLDGIGSDTDLRAVVHRVLADAAEPGQEDALHALRLGVVLVAPGQPARPAEQLLADAEAAAQLALPGGWRLATEALEVVFEPQLRGDDGRVLVLGALAQGAAPPAADPSLAVADSRLQQLLAQAAGPFKRWREASPEQAGQRQSVRLGLALSAAQATRAAWADELQAMLASHGLAPSSLLLELPPTLAYDDRNLRERLAALAALGCELAINRFGTGTATLSALEKLPLALLKIDAGVIEGALSREHHRVLLEAIVRVARSQGMATLAQGVASGRALARVCELGCDRVEGPLPRRSAAPLLQGLALLA